MRFLLLCPVALLLLTAPAKTLPIDADQPKESSAEERVDSSPSPATPTPNTSPASEPVSTSTELPGSSTSDTTEQPVLDQPDPKLVRKLRRRLAKAEAELKALKIDNTVLGTTLQATHSKMTQLMKKGEALAAELQSTRNKLRQSQDKLHTEDGQDGQCKPSESELDKLIEEESIRLLEERKADVERFYEKKYKKLLKELRLRVRANLNLNDDPTYFHPNFLTSQS